MTKRKQYHWESVVQLTKIYSAPPDTTTGILMRVTYYNGINQFDVQVLSNGRMVFSKKE